MTPPAAARLTATLLFASAALVFATPQPAVADTTRDAQWYLGPLGVQQAWQTTRGAGVTVCVVDSGIDAQVPDLQGAVVQAKVFARYVDSDGLVAPHGTGVAALLAGRGHGGSDGVIGVAPQARLLSAVVNEYDTPVVGKEVPAAIRWCTDQGAGVINLSIAEKAEAGMSAAVDYAGSKDVVVVAASGNTFEKITTDVLPYPAVLPGVVAVTGIDQDLRHDGGAGTSSRGKPVSLSAPFSTTDGTSGYAQLGLPAALPRNDPSGAPYATHAVGTSYSSPIVAGVAALVRAAHPDYTANQVIQALLSTASPAGSGRVNRTYGHGIVNAAAAVAADVAPLTANPLITAPSSAPPTSRATATPTAAAPATPRPAPAGTTTTAAASADGSSGGLRIGLIVGGLVLVAGAVTLVLRRRRTAP